MTSTPACSCASCGLTRASRLSLFATALRVCASCGRGEEAVDLASLAFAFVCALADAAGLDRGALWTSVGVAA